MSCFSSAILVFQHQSPGPMGKSESCSGPPWCYPGSTMLTLGPPCYPGSRWEDGEMVAQENPPEIPVGAITHHQRTGATHALACVAVKHTVWCNTHTHAHTVWCKGVTFLALGPRAACKLELPLLINSALSSLQLPPYLNLPPSPFLNVLTHMLS